MIKSLSRSVTSDNCCAEIFFFSWQVVLKLTHLEQRKIILIVQLKTHHYFEFQSMQHLKKPKHSLNS